MTAKSSSIGSLITLPANVQGTVSEKQGILTIELPRAVAIGDDHYDIKIVRPIGTSKTALSNEEIQQIQQIYKIVFSAIEAKNRAQSQPLTPDRIALWTDRQKTDVLIAENAAHKSFFAERQSDEIWQSSFSAQTLRSENSTEIHLLPDDIQQLHGKPLMTVHDAMLRLMDSNSQIGSDSEAEAEVDSDSEAEAEVDSDSEAEAEVDSDSDSESSTISRSFSRASSLSSFSSSPPPLLPFIPLHVSAVKSASQIRFRDLRRTHYPMLNYLDTMPEGRGMRTRFFEAPSNKDRHINELRKGFVKLLNNPQDRSSEAQVMRALLNQWFKYLCEYWKTHKCYIQQTKEKPAQSPEVFADYWLHSLLIGSTEDATALSRLTKAIASENASQN